MSIYRRKYWTPTHRRNLLDTEEYANDQRLRDTILAMLTFAVSISIMLIYMGCSSAMNVPITAANSALAMMDSIAPVIHFECVVERQRENEECVQAIHAAADDEDKLLAENAYCDQVRTERDRFCEPVVRYFKMAKLSHATLVASIQAVETDQSDPAEVLRRANELAVAIRLLGEALAEKGEEK